MRAHAPTGPASPSGSFRYAKILALTDFSDCAERAFDVAVALARQHGADLHLLHVMGPLEADLYSPLHHSPEARARHQTPDEIIYDHLRAWCARAEPVEVRPVKRRATSVRPAILQYAASERIDLIVMGTHGRQGMPRVLLGSVAEQVVRHAPCSVLTVRERPRGERPDAAAGLDLERILVPLDFSEHAPPLLRVAHALAAPSGAQLDLLHVIEPVPFLGLLTGMMTVHDLVPDLTERVQGELRALWEELEPGGVRAKLHVEEGHAARQVVDLAARCASDLIVIGAQGHSAAERFLMGSTVERVVRSAACPVLVHKEPVPDAPTPPGRRERHAAPTQGGDVLSEG